MEQDVPQGDQHHDYAPTHHQTVTVSTSSFDYSFESQTIQVLAFKFQIDETGEPWLLKVKGDLRFEPKFKSSSASLNQQNFDDLKAHLLNEAIKVAERKIKLHREALYEKVRKPEISDVLKEATSAAQI